VFEVELEEAGLKLVELEEAGLKLVELQVS